MISQLQWLSQLIQGKGGCGVCAPSIWGRTLCVAAWWQDLGPCWFLWVCFGVGCAFSDVLSRRGKFDCFLGFCGLGWLAFSSSLPPLLAFWCGLYTSLCTWLRHLCFLIYSIFYLSKKMTISILPLLTWVKIQLVYCNSSYLFD